MNYFTNFVQNIRSDIESLVNSFNFTYRMLQDKNVAFKIFELGLKKFGEHPEYICAYLDFMSHLNGKLIALW